jgi:hypothetical protein
VSNMVFYYEQGNLTQEKRELAVAFVPVLIVGALSALALAIDRESTGRRVFGQQQ